MPWALAICRGERKTWVGNALPKAICRARWHPPQRGCCRRRAMLCRSSRLRHPGVDGAQSTSRFGHRSMPSITRAVALELIAQGWVISQIAARQEHTQANDRSLDTAAGCSYPWFRGLWCYRPPNRCVRCVRRRKNCDEERGLLHGSSIRTSIKHWPPPHALKSMR